MGMTIQQMQATSAILLAQVRGWMATPVELRRAVWPELQGLDSQVVTAPGAAPSHLIERQDDMALQGVHP